MMSVSNLIAEEMKTNEFWAGIAKFEFMISISKVMSEKSITKSELARRIGKSPAYVTKIMQGDVNLTIESMVMIARAVGLKFTPAVSEEPITKKTSNVVSILYRPNMPTYTQVYCHG